MILLDNVSIYQPGSNRQDFILHDQTTCFSDKTRVGILAPPGSGRTTIARLLCGIQPPDLGNIFVEGSVSWPIGYAGLFHPHLTLASNIGYIAKLTCTERAEIEAITSWMCEDDAIFSRMVSSFTPGERGLVSFAVSLSVPADFYIADEKIMISDPNAVPRAERLLQERLEGRGLIFISRNAKQLDTWCDIQKVLMSGKLVDCPDAQIGQKMLDLAARSHIERSSNDAK